MSRRLNVSASDIHYRLFDSKSSTPLYPWLMAGDTLPASARRNPGEARCSVPLIESIAMGLRADVLEARPRLQNGDGLWIRMRPKPRTRGERVLTCIGNTIGGLKRVDADLGVVVLVEALAAPGEAGDLLDAWGELLAAWQHNDRRLDEAIIAPVARVADELWYWLCYRGGEATYASDRLMRLNLCDATEEHPDPASDDLAPLLTDLEALTVYRQTGLVVPSRQPEALARRVEGASFRGPQLGQLVMALERGMHAILVGPRGTGKSLCATEAARFAHRELVTVEGHESLQPVDLLGGYIPDQAVARDPYELQAEVACLIAGGESTDPTAQPARYAWADGPLTQAMRGGMALFVDEANRMPGKTLNVLLGAISRRAMVLTEHGAEELRAGEGFVVLLAMNQGKGYLVNQVDPALADRFPVTLEFDYLEAGDEATLLRGRTGVPVNVARWMVRVANETRAMRTNRQLPADVTPRGLIAWGELVARPLQGPGDPGRILTDAALICWVPGVAGRDADGRVVAETRELLLQMIANHRPAGI